MMKRILIGLLFAAFQAPPAPVASTSTPVVVRSTEIDVNGHVNNAKAIEYLQWGRWDWLVASGFGRERLTVDGLALVVVHIDASYRREMKEGDGLVISTAPARVGGKSFDLRQEIKVGEAVAVDAVVTLVVIDRATRKAVEIPAGLRAVIAPEGNLPQ